MASGGYVEVNQQTRHHYVDDLKKIRKWGEEWL